MELIGSTAIEDKLQDEVPEVIADLAKGGVTLWMLTGDKEETAIQIGFSCNLLLPSTVMYFLTNLQSTKLYQSRLEDIYQQIIEAEHDEDTRGCALVMDGPSLNFFEPENPLHRDIFLGIGAKARAVIACRLTPSQKQLVVGLIKDHSDPKVTTLAIGDGANDVSMIREADVGIGIIGKEGMQAANNSDFAIGEFKFLRILMLVHGRWNYTRQSSAFLYSLHKNIVITLTLFWYNYNTATSGTSPYESFVYTGFNLFLALPIIVYGILDQDISPQFALRYPVTYSTGRTYSQLNARTIATWIANAIVYAVILCSLHIICFFNTYKEYDLYSFGTTLYVSLVMALQYKVWFLLHQWNIYFLSAILVSIVGMFAVIYILSESFAKTGFLGVTSEFDDVAGNLYFNGDENAFFWVMGFIFTPLCCLLFDVLVYSARILCFPTREMHFREKLHETLFKSSDLSTFRKAADECCYGKI